MSVSRHCMNSPRILLRNVNHIAFGKKKRKNAEETARTVIEGCEHKVASQERELLLAQKSLQEARQESEETLLQYEAINQTMLRYKIVGTNNNRIARFPRKI